MITVSFVINIVMGVTSMMNLGNDDLPPGPRLLAFIVGACLITFGIIGLANG